MKLRFYTHYTMWYITPVLAITYEKNYYLSIDFIWIRWGISLELNNKEQ